jgi:UDP-galactose transporter B1
MSCPAGAVLQDNVHKAYPDTGALWSMCWMNFWCSLYNCAYLFGFTRAGWELLAFCRQHPEVQERPQPLF